MKNNYDRIFSIERTGFVRISFGTSMDNEK